MSDILSLSMVKYVDLNETEKQVMQIQVISTASCKTLDDFIQRIAEYVHWMSINQTPIKFSSLSRRFGRTATKFGTDMQDVLRILVQRGLVISKTHANNVLICSKLVSMERAANADDLADLQDSERRFWSQAQ